MGTNYEVDRETGDLVSVGTILGADVTATNTVSGTDGVFVDELYGRFVTVGEDITIHQTLTLSGSLNAFNSTARFQTVSGADISATGMISSPTADFSTISGSTVQVGGAVSAQSFTASNNISAQSLTGVGYVTGLSFTLNDDQVAQIAGLSSGCLVIVNFAPTTTLDHQRMGAVMHQNGQTSITAFGGTTDWEHLTTGPAAPAFSDATDGNIAFKSISTGSPQRFWIVNRKGSSLNFRITIMNCANTDTVSVTTGV